MKKKDESRWIGYAKDRAAKGIQRICWLAVLLLLCSVPKIFAQTAARPSDDDSGSSSQPRQYLLGDWGGERSRLSEKGIRFDVFYVSDFLANPSGGLQQTQAGWNRVRGTIDINFDRILPWQGLTFHATGLWQTGVDLGAKIGTLANPSVRVWTPFGSSRHSFTIDFSFALVNLQASIFTATRNSALLM
jgi:carbohydrate-selective porin OprB